MKPNFNKSRASSVLFFLFALFSFSVQAQVCLNLGGLYTDGSGYAVRFDQDDCWGLHIKHFVLNADGSLQRPELMRQNFSIDAKVLCRAHQCQHGEATLEKIQIQFHWDREEIFDGHGTCRFDRIQHFKPADDSVRTVFWAKRCMDGYQGPIEFNYKRISGGL